MMVYVSRILFVYTSSVKIGQVRHHNYTNEVIVFKFKGHNWKFKI